jgi:general secretion pathway protein F
VVDALKAMIDQVESQEFERIFRDVREKVTQGEGLADALAHHPDYFSELYVNMVRAGEASGRLDEILARLADYITRVNRLRNKVTSALTYPVIMITVGGGVVTMLMTVVVPKLTSLFKQAGKTLPGVTQALIAISHFFQNYWWSLIVLIALAWLFRRAVLATEDGRLRYDRWIMKLPVVGELDPQTGHQSLRDHDRHPSALRNPVLEAMDIVKKVVQNAVISKALEESRTAIIEGSDIATPLMQSGAFPSMVGYMIKTGEQSGQLDEILERISQAYDEEVEITTQRLTAVLEPAILVVLAVVVGFCRRGHRAAAPADDLHVQGMNRIHTGRPDRPEPYTPYPSDPLRSPSP